MQGRVKITLARSNRLPSPVFKGRAGPPQARRSGAGYGRTIAGIGSGPLKLR